MDPARIAALPDVQRARALLQAQDAETLEQQIRIASIPSPTGAEAARARFVESHFRELGLAEVHTDEAGNVLGRLPGAEAARPVIVSAHLDTVFPAGTEIAPRREGERVWAPGITDDARGLAAVLALARVTTECGIRTERPLWFVATVGEEGAGDLRGVKHLFRAGSPFAAASAFVSLDGSGLRRIVCRAIGSRRLRVRVRGPGGHSWSDFGTGNPIHALGLAIARLRQVRLSTHPPATLTVARFGGGTSINAIPAEAWMELDLRSEDPEVLARTEAAVRRELSRAVAEEDPARHTASAQLSLEVTVIGDRPPGETAGDLPLVRAAADATRIVGCQPELAAASTDSNVPISLGIPAVTIGAGGDSGGVHTLEEWYDNREGTRGIERSLLLVLAAAGIRSGI
jgi:tripeptide aminopeptidase